MKNRDIVDIHDAPEEGLGYLTDEEAILLTDYCKAQGAEIGQTVLIHTNW